MHIVFCRSNPIDPDPRVEKAARCLQAAGHQVSVVGWDRSGKLPQWENAGGILVSRLRIRAGYAHGLRNLFPLLLWQIRLLSWLVRHRADFQVVHACDFDTILPALACQKLFHKKIVYDIFDFYADHLRATPALLKQAIRAADLWAVRQADAVILADPARLEQIARSAPPRLEVIYNTPEDRPDLLQADGAQTPAKLRLAYIGLLQVERGLLQLLLVLRRNPDWQFDLAGFGGDQALILAEAGQLPNVTWHGRLKYHQALELEAASDVLVALYDPAILNHRFASPNKVFEAMMLGKPVVAARGTNFDRLVDRWNCGIVVEYGQVDELEHALIRLANDISLRRLLGMNARRAYESEYNWDIMKLRLLRLYEQT